MCAGAGFVSYLLLVTFEFRNNGTVSQMWTTVADLYAKHREFVLGGIVALVLMAMYDVLKVGSIFGLRQISNKLSEISVYRLRNRIRSLEDYRDALKSAETQDKTLLLIRFALSVIMLMSIGTLSMILDTLFAPPDPIFRLSALAAFSAAIGGAAKGLNLTVLNNEERASLVVKLTADIDNLSRKLRARTGSISE
jgi:hypothetical protein